MKTKYQNRFININTLSRSICLICILFFHQAYAATYYVSPKGIDSRKGTSLSLPLKTITKGLALAKLPGDIVYVMTGTYQELVRINNNNITLSAYPDNKPIIDGGTILPNKDWSTLLGIDGSNNIVSGFEIKNSNITGKYLYGAGVQIAGNNNVVSKMNVHHTWANGILISGDSNTVEDSTVSLSNLMFTAMPDKGWASGLSAARGSRFSKNPSITSNAIIRRNIVFNNWGEGLSCYEADHCTIEDNVVYDNYAVNLYLSDATNSVVQRNLVYISSNPAIKLQSRAGIALADEVSAAPRSANNTLTNNCLFNAGFHAFAWTLVPNSGLNNVLIDSNTVVDENFTVKSGGSFSIVNVNSTVSNNIFMGNDIHQVDDATGITFFHNNWYLVVPTAGSNSTDVIGDPQIVKPGTISPGSLSLDYCKLPATAPAMIAAKAQLSNDATVPTTPSGLIGTATGTSSRIDLVWRSSTDKVGFAGYKVYREGKEIGTSVSANFTDITVAEGTTYHYTVVAYDAAGNLSSPSNTATVKTQAEAVKILRNTVTNITKNSATIQWSTNKPATGKVTYFRSGSREAVRSVTLNIPKMTQSITLPRLARNAKYDYSISVGADHVATNTPDLTPSFRTKR